ncbi:DNA lyase [Eremomyces bilateralis CBS 781.70]|uniref:DNA-(apurinic or apyrimidinic site) endonuclease 2 n=1 Tax=Eremomyces bilateralis CBS 781.70 TaxID=1392243 RepID=A0A6G1FZ56_9PEZI|nr:DNA lyase [Eremomyces bilateralis CBS 781.70]KAF1811074.1 DNA lyase [Eremomyces bilateralis CBS 781.70]
MALRLTTWNVNGIRNPFGYQPWREKRTFDAMFNTLEADIVVMQELKIQRKDLTDDMVLIPGWDCFFSLPKHKKGYSGVGIYTRQSACIPIKAEEGLLGILTLPGTSTRYRDLPAEKAIGGYPTEEQIEEMGVDAAALDAEGRCVILEFPAFVIFGVYCPANSNGLRDDFRYGFFCALETRIRNLDAMGKRIILTGDLNVSRDVIDTARAIEAIKKEGITYDEYVSSPNRRLFNQLVEDSPVVEPRDQGREHPVLWDVPRGFHPTRQGMFTHWEQKINARPANFGSRIDHVLSSISMKEWFIDSNIQEGLMGSDHCPVYAIMGEKVQADGKETFFRDIMHPGDIFKDGVRLREPGPKDLLPLSGKLLPEFDKRRSIRDMFGRKQSSGSAPKPGALSPSQSQSSATSIGIYPTQTESSTPSTAPITSTEPKTPISPRVSRSGVSPSARASPVVSNPSNRVTNERPSKRAKLGSSTSSLPATSKGQKSLKSFFQAKSTVPNGSSSRDRSASISETPSQPGTAKTATAVANSDLRSESNPTTLSTASPNPTPKKVTNFETEATKSAEPFSAKGESDDVYDPIVTKESWDKVFKKRKAPLCEGHEEPCISLSSKKKGVNVGRYFWICPRPIGPSGNKEKGTHWRCHTFIWASDWNGQG